MRSPVFGKSHHQRKDRPMREEVTFEGSIKIRGSLQTVERILAKLAKEKEITFDPGRIPFPPGIPVPPFRSEISAPALAPDIAVTPWDRGIPAPVLLQAILNEKFVAEQFRAATRRTAKGKKAALPRRLPDAGIRGGRKYPHLHLNDRIMPLDSKVYNELLLAAQAELNKLAPPNQIGR